MNLLALDTSSIACSVAVANGDDIVERHEEQAREHTRLLMPMVKAALAEASLAVHELDAIVLGNGPGSFIGMRIGTSVAQGLAHGIDAKVIPVSSLAAIAAEVFAVTDVQEVAVAQDAHMDEVYLGLYSRGDEDVPTRLIAERLQSCESIIELQATDAHRASAGLGWQRYPLLLSANQQHFSMSAEIAVPHARYLLDLASLDDAVLPQEVQPAYLRETVAQKPGS